MNRQLFIHHYLPAHLCSALVAGATLNFIISESINYPISVASSITRRRPRQYTDLGVKAVATIAVFNLLFISMFIFLAPLTYGTPGYVAFSNVSVVFVLNFFRLDGDQVNRRILLPSWTLHFAVSYLASIYFAPRLAYLIKGQNDRRIEKLVYLNSGLSPVSFRCKRNVYT